MSNLQLKYNISKPIDTNMYEAITQSINAFINLYKCFNKNKQSELKLIKIENIDKVVIAYFEGENIKDFNEFIIYFFNKLNKYNKKTTYLDKIKAFFGFNK
ncbi:MAG TPA: hypothetical protein VN698_03425 [Bacteroidia bacterium]|nr:hypothetical protein [Bacteroidia bacterium]